MVVTGRVADSALALGPLMHVFGWRADEWDRLASGTLAGHLKAPMFGDPISDELKKQTKSLFRGIHVFVSGGTWDWYRPLYPGDRIMSFNGEESLEVKKSEFAGRSVAVANAAALVRAAATHVTASNDDDGVAQVIESLLAEPR